MSFINKEKQEQISLRLKTIYPDGLPEGFMDKMLDEIRAHIQPQSAHSKWDESDIVLITYGDSIVSPPEKGLKVLHRFLHKHLSDELSFVHILPFYPYTSDDGFSVVDYIKVNPDLGTWDDIDRLHKDFDLMFDLVINHISQKSEWFQNYLEGRSPGRDYFIEVDPQTDLTCVVRPRSLPLLTPFDTSRGTKYVWTTFSGDQIDLDFSNPEVLFQMVKVLLHYLDKGARMVRMDAIAFLWKEIGTTCLHLPQTHDVVKLLRDIMEIVRPDSILLTETNVPNSENLSYFDNGDEAHAVYQFPLPPLLLHALYSGNAQYFNEWASTIPILPQDATFFNFTASHDGVGLRPLENLIPDREIQQLADAMQKLGGQISTRRRSDGSDSPYEINISYFDAMQACHAGIDEMQEQRFLASQTLLMVMKGMPAFYIHSLVAGHNDYRGMEKTGRARSINRRKWDEKELDALLNGDNEHSRILRALKHRISIRKKQPAFHPDARQEIIDLGDQIIAIKRTSDDRKQVILCLTNISNKAVKLEYGDFPDFDLLTNKKIEAASDGWEIMPYQILWLL